MELTVLEAVIGVFSVFQFLLVGILLRGGRWRRPTLLVTGILFLLNGLVGLSVVTAAATSPREFTSTDFLETDHWRARIEPLFDEPTNFLLLILGILLFSPRFEREAHWPRGLAVGLVLVGVFAAVHAALRLAIPPSQFPYGVEFGILLRHVPLYAGYSLILLAAARRFAQGRGSDGTGEPALLLFGWGARPVQFAFVAAFPMLLGEPVAGEGALLVVNASAHLVLLATSVVAVAWTAWTVASRRGSWLRARWWAPLGLAMGGALGFSLYVIPARSDAYAAAQLMTLIVVRPILVGAAYRTPETLHLTFRVLVWAAAMLTVKAIFALSLGYPVLAIEPWDAAALPLGAMLAMGTDRAIPRIERFLRNWHASWSRPPIPGQPASNEERILAALVAACETEADATLTAARLSDATGIVASNVHRELRKIRGHLVRHAPPGTPETRLMPRVKPLEGQGYRIQLTPPGLEAARRRLAEMRAAPQPRAPATASDI